jgi:hypothetical protein
VKNVRCVHSSIGDPQDSARVVLVVRDTTIAHPSVGHDRIQTRVGHRQTTAARRRLSAAADEGIDSRVPPVLLLNLGIPACRVNPPSRVISIA